MPAVFYCANTTARAVGMALDQLKDGKHAVIVPDRFTLSVEREIFERLGKRATFDIDVLSFSRLAVRILEGGRECLSKEGAVMVLKRVLRKHRDELVHYGRAALKAGFAGELYAAIASFRVMGTTPEQLRTAAATVGGATAKKLTDLALLMEAYVEAAGEQYTDTLLRYEQAAARASDCTYLKERHVTVAGFDFFTGKQLQFIGALMASAPSFRVALCPTNHGANAEIYPMGTFTSLKSIAEERGVPYRIEESSVVLPAPFDFINRNLFAYNDLTADGKGRVHLYREPNSYDMFQATAREIRRLTDEEGLRFRQIAILNPVAELNVALQDVFTRYRIPVWFDHSRTLHESAAAGFVLALSECATFHYRRDKVVALAKNPLWAFPLAVIDGFENEALRRGINYDAFLTPWEGADDAYEGVRAALVAAVERLPQSTAELSQYVKGVRAALKGLSDAETAIENAPDAEFERASLERLDEVLEEMCALIGSEPVDGAAFRDQFAASAGAETISAIPSKRDVVFVGDLGESRFNEIKALFVVNAAAGVFPRDFGYQAVLSAVDVEALSACGVGVYPTPLQQGMETEFRILDLFTKAEVLYLGVADCDPMGKWQTPGVVYNELKRMLRLPERRLNEEFLSSANTPEGLVRYAVTPENAHFELPLLSKGARGAQGRQAAANLAASLEIKEVERPEAAPIDGPRLLGEGTVSVSQLESYFNCPYKHLLNYGLGLKQREEGELRVTDVGTLFHAALERYFRAYVQEGGAQERLPSPAAVAKAVVDEERAKYRAIAPMLGYTLDAVERQCTEVLEKLGERARRSGYQPQLIEAFFGMGESDLKGLKLHVNGRDLMLRGKIDRVDVRPSEQGTGVAIIDYKTGNSSHGDLDRVYYGTQIQLFVYLNALKELGYCPEGAFYLPITFKNARGGGGAEMRMQGQVLNDRGVLDALDRDLYDRFEREGVAESETMELKLTYVKKSGDTKGSGSDLLTDAGMEKILDYVKRLVENAASEIMDGYAEKAPLKKCRYCDYKGLCGGPKEIRRDKEVPDLFKSGGKV